MAGVGRPPSGARSRERDNPVRELVKSDGKLGGFALPDDILPLNAEGVREQWHPATLRWWANWRRSPQGVRMMTEPDWDYLLDTALLHHQMWQSGGKNSERAAEIRIRVAEFGSTPAARMRLRMEIEVPEEFPVGNRGTNVTSIASRKKSILAG